MVISTTADAPTTTAAPRPRTAAVSEADRGIARALRAWCEHGDHAAREQVIEHFTPLALRLARKYATPTGEPLDDLRQVALLGLVKAVDRFDLGRGLAFSSFATPTILGELRRYFRDHTRTVHVPRGLQDDMQLVQRAAAGMASPTPVALAERTGISEERVVEALVAARTVRPGSLDEPQGDEDGSTITLADRCGTQDAGFERVEELGSVAPVVATFSERDRKILHLRFVEDLTQAEIGERVGISQMQVSRTLSRCTAALRAAR